MGEICTVDYHGQREYGSVKQCAHRGGPGIRLGGGDEGNPKPRPAGGVSISNHCEEQEPSRGAARVVEPKI
ncbi:hypothetical protein MCOR27_006356, partial [Pyricularia oryzae]